VDWPLGIGMQETVAGSLMLDTFTKGWAPIVVLEKWTDDIAIPSKFNAGREKTALLDKITLSFNAL
jgi:hypothetical protein